jgi:hypothetical protein
MKRGEHPEGTEVQIIRGIHKGFWGIVIGDKKKRYFT